MSFNDVVQVAADTATSAADQAYATNLANSYAGLPGLFQAYSAQTRTFESLGGIESRRDVDLLVAIHDRILALGGVLPAWNPAFGIKKTVPFPWDKSAAPVGPPMYGFVGPQLPEGSVLAPGGGGYTLPDGSPSTVPRPPATVPAAGIPPVFILGLLAWAFMRRR